MTNAIKQPHPFLSLCQGKTAFELIELVCQNLYLPDNLLMADHYEPQYDHGTLPGQDVLVLSKELRLETIEHTDSDWNEFLGYLSITFDMKAKTVIETELYVGDNMEPCVVDGLDPDALIGLAFTKLAD